MKTLLPISLLLIAFTTSLFAQTDDQIAMQFYPKALDENFLATHNPEKTVVRLVTTLRVDLEGSGQDKFIAAAFTNGMAGILRIIKTSGPTPVLVAESTDQTMGGGGPASLYAADIDNDGIPEIVVEFKRASWIYRYQNGQISLYGPTRRGPLGLTSGLGWTTCIDIDGDGILEILEYPTPDGYGAPYIVYKLNPDGTFTQTSTKVFFVDWFEPHEDKPVVQDRYFPATPGKSYTLRVINGDQRKNGYVTAAEIRLNGATVFGLDDFKNAQRIMAIPVGLLKNNHLRVELRSAPAWSMFTVVILGN